MDTDRLSYKSKVHLFFGFGLFLVLSVNIVMNLSSGLTFTSAMVGALGQIRPVEYGMYLSFWYWLARGQQAKPRPLFTSLNLRGSKSS